MHQKPRSRLAKPPRGRVKTPPYNRPNVGETIPLWEEAPAVAWRWKLAMAAKIVGVGGWRAIIANPTVELVAGNDGKPALYGRTPGGEWVSWEIPAKVVRRARELGVPFRDAAKALPSETPPASASRS